jgi:hypothetical protein
VDVTIRPQAGQAPRIEWESDGCVAVTLVIQGGDAGTVFWAITLADEGWDAVPGLPSTITYGVVPAGARQFEPSTGSAPGLVSGEEYLALLTTRGREVGVYYSWLINFVQP